MITIQATRPHETEKTFNIDVHNVQPGAVVELRFQDTSNGVQLIELLSQADDSGSVRGTYEDFGHHVAIRARVLDSGNDEKLFQFVLDPAASTPPNVFSYITSEEYGQRINAPQPEPEAPEHNKSQETE